MKYQSMNVGKPAALTIIIGLNGCRSIGTSEPCVLLTIELI